MKRLGIISALPGELKPLVRGWQKRGRNTWAGQIAEFEAFAVAGGIGAKAAARAAERVFAEFAPEALVSYGWAGALTCAVKPPMAHPIGDVIDAGTGERFVTGSPGYRLITLDRVAGANEKHGLAQRFQSALVDMEAAAVARVAAARGIPFYCFKGVSDGYTDELPDLNQFIDGEGQLKIAALLAHVAVRPGYWASMQRLGKNSGAAASAVAEVLKESMKDMA
jgi:adenosylhomocysteine nucleosidase